MPSTSAPTSNPSAGITVMPGLQVSPYGAGITTFKVYNFGITDVREITATSTAGSYTVSGLTTNDTPVCMSPSTSVVAPSTAERAFPAAMFVRAANTLDVAWTARGTSTSMAPGWAAPGAAWTLFTLSYYNQSSSTTT